MKYIVIIASVLLFGCSGAKTVSSEMANATKTLVEGKSFRVLQREANPLATNGINQLANADLLGLGNNGNTIYLEGRGDFIEIRDTAAKADMSYYGEVRSAMNLTGGDVGIRFDAEVLDYAMQYHDIKQKSEISFSVRGKRETYDFNITVFANRKVTTVVNSSNRTTIRYTGTIEMIEK